MRLHRVPHALLVLVGDALFGETDYAQNLRAHVKALGIEERAHFAGFQHDAASWMNVKDVVVHASTQPEPFGLVIIDAMPAGKPVIASNGGAAPEILRDRENGLIVEPADAGQHFSIERYLRHMTRMLFDIAAPAPKADGDVNQAKHR